MITPTAQRPSDMTPDYTAIRVSYYSAESNYILQETIVLDAELVDDYGYIETEHVYPGLTNLRDARTQGTLLLHQMKQGLTEPT